MPSKVALTWTSLRGLREATGLCVRTLRGMQLARYDQAAIDLAGLDLSREVSLTVVAAREWMTPHSSRACPPCLAKSPVWPLWWRLGIAAVCPTHHCLLIDVCPSCGVRLRRGSERAPRGLLTRPPWPGPGECGNRPPHGPKGRAGLCHQQLAALPAVAVPDAVAELQRRALRVADGRCALLAGEPVAAGEWFAALRRLHAMTRLAALDDDLVGLPDVVAHACQEQQQRRTRSSRGGGGIRLGAMPATAAEALAALVLADRVLGAPSMHVGATRLASWLERLTVQRRAAGRTDPLRYLPRSPVLERMIRAGAPRSSRVAGALDAAGHGLPVLAPRHLPHLAHPRDYQELLAAHLPGTAEASGRRLAVLALARLAGAGSWAAAAASLGLHEGQAVRAADALVRRIGDPDAFWQAIGAMAGRMRQRGLVDYATRRAALADLREVPHRVLAPILHPLGWVVTWQRRRHAAVWVWQHLTQGDVRDAPAYTWGWQDGTATESIREGWRRFDTRLPAPAADALTAWGTTRLARRECR
ncbi:TniQ family protein [Streptomyces lunalinharesii]|uniref:TniQ domain-containing protein n=1 Tax=Streptomyces lunalinharesii TaxID=333384 RepID=A0ABP6E1G4_9ACTN